jgi:hypothetical protein
MPWRPARRGHREPPGPRRAGRHGIVPDADAREEDRKVSGRAFAAITIGAVAGGALGLLLGVVSGADNPFTYMAIGIAVGAGASLAYPGARGGGG